MSWSDNDRHQFILHLIELGTISKAAMMETLYRILVEDHERILNNGVSTDRIHEALDQLIHWFEEKERYEYCHKLKHIKECLK